MPALSQHHVGIMYHHHKGQVSSWPAPLPVSRHAAHPFIYCIWVMLKTPGTL